LRPQPQAIGCDVGGTKLAFAVLDEEGSVITELRRPTPEGGKGIVEAIVTVARSLSAEYPSLSRLGVGVPGLVTGEGVLLRAPNLAEAEGLELTALLSAGLSADLSGVAGDSAPPTSPPGRGATQWTVAVANDADCATAAEWQQGAGRGSSDLLLVTLGTGIGGGIVSAGALWRGAHGFGAEFGHMVVDPSGPICPCGRRGCWERVASGSTLGALGRRRVAIGKGRRIGELAGGSFAAVTGEHVVAAAGEGDEDALELLYELGGQVALGLANLTAAFDPEVIILGGGVSGAGALLLGPVRSHFAALVLGAPRRRPPEVRLARLGASAGAIGAGLLPGLATSGGVTRSLAGSGATRP